MGQAGSRSYVIRDSSIDNEVFISSSRTEESQWDVVNSTLEGRIKRDLAQLTMPLPQNYTIVDTSEFSSPILVQILFCMGMINLALLTVVLIQLSKF